MKKLIPHLAFVIAMFLLCFSVVEFYAKCFFCGRNNPSQIAFFIAVTLLVLLWKYNYFTRNKE
ncbi:MAG: hypothetical protein ISP60_00690 [Flavobacteriaceae bacterium]|nr:hypothetical protein [Flavobacteriaceae bacterium]